MTAGSDDEFEDMLCVERETGDEDSSNDCNTPDSGADNPRLQTQPPQTPTQTSTPSASPPSSVTSTLQHGRPTTARMQHPETHSPQRGRPTTARVQLSPVSRQRGRPTTARVQHSTTPTLSVLPATPPTQPDIFLQHRLTTAPSQRVRAAPTSQRGCSTTWSSTLTPVDVAPFTQPVGPTVPISTSPVEVFTLFFTDDIVTHIVEQSNLYAKQVLGEERYVEWEKISATELRAYFGFKILMGLYPKPAVRDYWKRALLSTTPHIREDIKGPFLRHWTLSPLRRQHHPSTSRAAWIRPARESQTSDGQDFRETPHCLQASL